MDIVIKDKYLESLDLLDRENAGALLQAMVLNAQMHNDSGLAAPVPVKVQDYYGRAIKVIFAEQWAESAMAELAGTELEMLPSIGSFSQLSGISDFSDDPGNYPKIADFYKA